MELFLLKLALRKACKWWKSSVAGRGDFFRWKMGRGVFLVENHRFRVFRLFRYHHLWDLKNISFDLVKLALLEFNSTWYFSSQFIKVRVLSFSSFMHHWDLPELFYGVQLGTPWSLAVSPSHPWTSSWCTSGSGSRWSGPPVEQNKATF